MTGTCYLCGVTANVEKHHVFGGALRKKSDRYGLTVDLCHYCHNEPPEGVHFNAEKQLELKQEFQRKAMDENGWDVDDFRAAFYKSYI